MTEKNKPWATLLSLSKLFKVKKATLIYYRQLGLLRPAMVIGQLAVFDEAAAIKDWKKIQDLRKAGKTLGEIREIFAKYYANKGR